MDDNQIIAYLNGLTGGSEAASVRRFRVWIGQREVDVTVYDEGPGAGNIRFSVEACWADIAAADRNAATQGWTLGNPESTLEAALHGPHWWIFRDEE